MAPQLLHSNELLISYSQLAVYNSGSDQPFPDWSDEDLAQGYACQQGSVAFSTMEDALCTVEMISASGRPEAEGEATLCITVPFVVHAGQEVTASSVMSDSVRAELPAGAYSLSFSAIPGAGKDGSWLYRLVFFAD